MELFRWAATLDDPEKKRYTKKYWQRSLPPDKHESTSTVALEDHHDRVRVTSFLKTAVKLTHFHSSVSSGVHGAQSWWASGGVFYTLVTWTESRNKKGAAD
ncbi:unnamed protein product, partial [Iphiclides podalirius]